MRASGSPTGSVKAKDETSTLETKRELSYEQAVPSAPSIETRDKTLTHTSNREREEEVKDELPSFDMVGIDPVIAKHIFVPGHHYYNNFPLYNRNNAPEFYGKDSPFKHFSAYHGLPVVDDFLVMSLLKENIAVTSTTTAAPGVWEAIVKSLTSKSDQPQPEPQLLPEHQLIEVPRNTVKGLSINGKEYFLRPGTHKIPSNLNAKIEELSIGMPVPKTNEEKEKGGKEKENHYSYLGDIHKFDIPADNFAVIEAHDNNERPRKFLLPPGVTVFKSSRVKYYGLAKLSDKEIEHLGIIRIGADKVSVVYSRSEGTQVIKGPCVYQLPKDGHLYRDPDNRARFEFPTKEEQKEIPITKNTKDRMEIKPIIKFTYVMSDPQLAVAGNSSDVPNERVEPWGPQRAFGLGKNERVAENIIRTEVEFLISQTDYKDLGKINEELDESPLPVNASKPSSIKSLERMLQERLKKHGVVLKHLTVTKLENEKLAEKERENTVARHEREQKDASQREQDESKRIASQSTLELKMAGIKAERDEEIAKMEAEAAKKVAETKKVLAEKQKELDSLPLYAQFEEARVQSEERIKQIKLQEEQKTQAQQSSFDQLKKTAELQVEAEKVRVMADANADKMRAEAAAAADVMKTKAAAKETEAKADLNVAQTKVAIAAEAARAEAAAKEVSAASAAKIRESEAASVARIKEANAVSETKIEEAQRKSKQDAAEAEEKLRGMKIENNFKEREAEIKLKALEEAARFKNLIELVTHVPEAFAPQLSLIMQAVLPPGQQLALQPPPAPTTNFHIYGGNQAELTAAASAAARAANSGLTYAGYTGTTFASSGNGQQGRLSSSAEVVVHMPENASRSSSPTRRTT